MGTSGSSSGSGSGTPLIPTWLEEPNTGPLPGSLDPETPDDTGNEDQGSDPKKPISPATEPERFRNARTNFSKFAGSGGGDRRALKRSVRDYVRNGIGGRKNAVLRMAISGAAVSNALSIFRGIQRDGISETLRRINLHDYTGRGVQDVFIGLTEVICQDGGSVDEAIARDAWLETIAVLDQFGIDNLESLSSDQIKEVFLNFIAHTIEARLYQEIGVNGFKFTANLEDIQQFDEQFRDYIERTVRDSFTSDLSELSGMTDQDIRKVVDQTYFEAWSLLELLGDNEE